MRIGIDISSVVYGTGVSLYTKNLVGALLKLDEENKYILFGGSLRRKGEIAAFVNSLKKRNVAGKTTMVPPTLLSFLWNDIHKVGIESFTGPLDVFHSSDWTQPPTRAFKVTTIHDLVPLRFPKISHPKIVQTHKKRLGWVKKEVDRIIAVSEFTEKEIVELLGIDPSRITVIYEAPDCLLKRASRVLINRVKKKYGIEKKYLLVVGADPRKNIPSILQAYGRIKRSEDIDLVIIGKAWETIPQEDGIHLLGHTENVDLSAFYSGAEALVYTSLYEGFGLPILEAMKVGCPVVTSNISSMPEVAGNAGVLVDPTSPVAIADGILKVLSERQVWVQKGKRHVEKFSWEKTAEQTLQVYREASKA